MTFSQATPFSPKTTTDSTDLIGSLGGIGSTGLLVSVRNWDEVQIAMDLGVHWLDLKEPLAGPLGRPDLLLVERTAQAFAGGWRPIDVEPTQTLAAGNRFIGSCVRWSVAGGELLDWDWDKDLPYLSALGSTGAIKWALAKCGTAADWPSRFERLVQQLSHRSQAILVHYADWQRCDAPAWSETLAVAVRLKLSQVLIDTAIKDGTTLLDHCSLETLQLRLHQASELGIGVALAGSISFAMLPQLLALHPQWVGMRGALCSGPARTSAISLEKVRFAVREIHSFGTTKPNDA